MSTQHDYNLDVNAYSYDELREVFKIQNTVLDENDLTKAKKMTLRMHPDKSGMDSSFFIFYREAYKKLTYMYAYAKTSHTSQTSQQSIENGYLPIENDDANTIAHSQGNLQKFAQKSFSNKEFNDIFNSLQLPNSKGHGDWLKSQTPSIASSKKLSKSEFNAVFENNKPTTTSLVEYKDMKNMGDNNNFCSILGNQTKSDYTQNHNIFSHSKNKETNFTDVKKAHTEGIIQVSQQSYLSKANKNSKQLLAERDMQETNPLNKLQSEAMMKEREMLEQKKSMERAFAFQNRVQQNEKLKQTFENNFMRIQY